MQRRNLLSLWGAAVGTVLACSFLVVAGCSSNRAQTGAAAPEPRAKAPMAQGGGGARGSQPTPPTDLTKPDAWGRGTVKAEIIDTRTFAQQINPVLPGPDGPRNIREMLPEEAADLPMQLGPGNDLPVGQSQSWPRASVSAKFPGIGTTAYYPPDPTLAVGPAHVVETVNVSIAWFDKAGVKEFEGPLGAGSGFFGAVGAGSFVFDPKCYFDQYSQRFVVTALDVDFQNAGAWILLAVSDDSDPNGIWYKYRADCRVQVGNATYWVDYPGFGYDANGIYLTGNLFILSGSGQGFAGAFYRSYKKSTMLEGGTAFFTDLRDSTAASVQAVQHSGNPPAPMFTSVNSTALIKIQAIKNAFTAPQLITTTVAIPDFQFPGNAVPDRDGNAYDQLDGRIINATWLDGRLLTGHGVGLSSRNVARWYEFDTHNWPTSGVPTLVQAGNVDGGAGVHTWFPALMQNRFGFIGMVLARSSNTTYPSIQVTGHLPNDPPGVMGAMTLVKAGTTGTGDWRWGDYFDLSLDPDGKTFWLAGEYYQGNGWKTWLSSFLISCPGDYNQDTVVDSRDVIGFLNDWSGHVAPADWNDDGAFDTRDVIAFLNDYALGC